MIDFAERDYCGHCDSYHRPGMCPVDAAKPKEQTPSERPGYFRGAKISKPQNGKGNGK